MDAQRKVLYYTTQAEDRPVHHNNPNCIAGGKIRIKDIRSGDDGRPLCDECAAMPGESTVS